MSGLELIGGAITSALGSAGAGAAGAGAAGASTGALGSLGTAAQGIGSMYGTMKGGAQGIKGMFDQGKDTATNDMLKQFGVVGIGDDLDNPVGQQQDTTLVGKMIKHGENGAINPGYVDVGNMSNMSLDKLREYLYGGTSNGRW